MDYQALRYRNLPQSWLYIRDWTRHHAKRLENEEKSFHVESEKKTKSCTYFVSSVRRTFFCDCKQLSIALALPVYHIL